MKPEFSPAGGKLMDKKPPKKSSMKWFTAETCGHVSKILEKHTCIHIFH